MEILELLKDRLEIKAVLFDFDGTISTLRVGWEKVMEPFMLEMISGAESPERYGKMVQEVKEYIDQSTGIQTFYQMQWLAEAVKRYGRNPTAGDDPWWFKAEYNRRLMKTVDSRKENILRGEKKPSDFMIQNSEAFLRYLHGRNLQLYVASGTDRNDVVEEAEILGLTAYFTEIAGAPPGKADCSKAAIITKLFEEVGIKGEELLVCGDGRVEISLGRQAGALTLGVASDEEKCCGINPVKRARLVRAGAHAVVGDFTEMKEIISWLGMA